MTERLIAAGRTAEVYDMGNGRVRRHYLVDLTTEREARLMTYLRGQGFPVPEVFDADGPDMVMERVEGPSMFAAVTRRPWTVFRQAALLAELHERLHAITAPEWLEAPLGEGTTVVHLDLHPLNVMLSPDGPVVIDWTGSIRGRAATDLAMTWVLMWTSEIPGRRVERLVGRAGQKLFTGSFLRRVDGPAAAAELRTVGAHRVVDPTVTEGERANIHALVAKQASPKA
ncbi:MAG: hypothetical protein QOG03_1139 [Actinomycetota bacterium]|jgi:aminoglycoside phosphotransferase (APT) family kinase protein|nr:hypothetical protein [Actinomycetota bacterium]